MLAEAAGACFTAGNAARHAVGGRTRDAAALSDGASVRSRFMAETALGMARVLGGDAAAGAEALHRAVALADGAPELKDDVQLLPWLTLGPIFLRKAGVGRSMLAGALAGRAGAGRDRRASRSCSFLLARDQATSDRWAVAEATYARRSAWRARAISAPISASASPVSPGSRRGGAARRDQGAGRRGDRAVRSSSGPGCTRCGRGRARRARARSRRRGTGGRALRGPAPAAARARDHRR